MTAEPGYGLSMECPACSRTNAPTAQFCVFCGTAVGTGTSFHESTNGLIGELLLGRYRVVRPIGEGGASMVYLAEQRVGGVSRPVAIKVLAPVMAIDDDVVARFRQECELLLSLQHPNTIRVYDFGDLPNGLLFIVMEYIEGAVPLSDVLPLPEQRALHVISQVASALHEAHSHRVIHRDLKPDNILISTRESQRDFVKVLDFGIAKRLGKDHFGESGLTRDGMVLGTPPYMSPEQFSGRPLDHRSDLYSLAVLSYELLTGSLPFEAEDPWSWAHQHMHASPTPIEEQPGGAALSLGVRRAIARALAKTPEERPADVITFARQLTSHVDPLDPTEAMVSAGTVPVSVPPPSALAPSNAPPPPVAVPPAPASASNRALPARKGRSRSLIWLVVLAALLGAPAAVAMGAYWLHYGERTASTAPTSVDPAATQGSVTGATAPTDTNAQPEAEVDAFESVHHVSSASNAQRALGPRDKQFAQIWAGGRITLELAPGREFRADGTHQPDLTVFAVGAPYEVQVSEDHHHFHTVAKHGGGSDMLHIDLDRGPVQRARFVRVNNQASRASLRLDAVHAAVARDAPTSAH